MTAIVIPASHCGLIPIPHIGPNRSALKAESLILQALVLPRLRRLVSTGKWRNRERPSTSALSKVSGLGGTYIRRGCSQKVGEFKELGHLHRDSSEIAEELSPVMSSSWDRCRGNEETIFEDVHSQRILLAPVANTKLQRQDITLGTRQLDEQLRNEIQYPTGDRDVSLIVSLYQLAVISIFMPWLNIVNGYISTSRGNPIINVYSETHSTNEWGNKTSPIASHMLSDVEQHHGRTSSHKLTQRNKISPFVDSFKKWYHNQEATDGASTTQPTSSNGKLATQPASPSNPGESGTATSTPGRNNKDGASDGKGDDDLPRAKRRKLSESTPNLRFACPFYKRDPDRYRAERTCTGPGWNAIHRVKEHLYRRHMKPRHVCPRCRENLNSEKELMQHSRSAIPCLTNDSIPNPEGITQEQEQELKRRKRSNPGLTDVEKWKEIYKIIFPDDEEIPFPFYERPETLTKGNHENYQMGFKHLIQDKLPVRVREVLETRFDQLDESVKSAFIEIIKDAISEILKECHTGDSGISTHDSHQGMVASTSGIPSVTTRRGRPASPELSHLQDTGYEVWMDSLNSQDVENASLFGYPPNISEAVLDLSPFTGYISPFPFDFNSEIRGSYLPTATDDDTEVERPT